MNPEWQSAVDRFREAATRFIKVVDSCDELTNDQFLTSIQGCLLELYNTVLLLPIAQPAANDSPPVAPYSREASPALCRRLTGKLGKRDCYWEIFDSTKFDKPVCGSLGDDISDIYFDLKESVYLANRNTQIEDSLWEIRFSFLTHWGRHLTSALKAIYDIHAN